MVVLLLLNKVPDSSHNIAIIDFSCGTSPGCNMGLINFSKVTNTLNYNWCNPTTIANQDHNNSNRSFHIVIITNSATMVYVSPLLPLKAFLSYSQQTYQHSYQDQGLALKLLIYDVTSHE